MIPPRSRILEEQTLRFWGVQGENRLSWERESRSSALSATGKGMSAPMGHWGKANAPSCDLMSVLGSYGLAEPVACKTRGGSAETGLMRFLSGVSQGLGLPCGHGGPRLASVHVLVQWSTHAF